MAARPAFPRLAIALVVLATLAATVAPSGGSVPAIAPLPTACEGPLGATLLPTGCEAWVASGDHGRDQASGIVASLDGSRVYVASSGTTGAGLVTVNLDAYSTLDGSSTWWASWRPSGTASVGAPRMLRISPDGAHLYLVGWAWAGPAPQAYALAYDARDEQLEWSFLGPASSIGNALAVSPDGGTVYLAGHMLGAEQGLISRNYLTLALDAQAGTILWQASYDGRGGHSTGWRDDDSYDDAFGVVTGADGRTVYVTGTSASPEGILEQTTVAYDATTGTSRWLSRFHATDVLGRPVPSEGYEVDVASDGGMVYALGSGGLQAFAAQTGVPSWPAPRQEVACRTLYPSLWPSECSLAYDGASGRVFALGFNGVAAVDALTGTVVWHLPLYTGAHTTLGTKAMALSPDGARLYLAGPGGKEGYVTGSTSTVDAIAETVALDARDGTARWRATYDRGAQDNAVFGVTVHPAGSHVYVAGIGTFPASKPYDLVTLAYPTTIGLDATP